MQATVAATVTAAARAILRRLRAEFTYPPNTGSGTRMGDVTATMRCICWSRVRRSAPTSGFNVHALLLQHRRPRYRALRVAITVARGVAIATGDGTTWSYPS
jgi:hypothetical protein